MASHRSFERSDRVAAQLRRELGLLVHEAVRRLGLPSVSVSDVELSRDLAHAKVFVVTSRPEDGPAALAVLNGLAREMRQRLARALRLRSVPSLSFLYDESLDRGARIEALLRRGRGDGDDA
ncbi:MAG: 30S ribosome-binding factor RbfA [Xanthomonadales bacterium]|nr:30S ribosome-binding factor RbfA [Xanthomonadales bacterium]